jgi:hypothetical protein
MTGKLFVKIIISSSAIITGIMICHKFKEPDRWIQAVVMKEMGNQLGYF